MPAAGHVYDLNVRAPVGPWKAGRHPGLVVSKHVGGPDEPWVVLPLTSSPPRPHSRMWMVELEHIAELASPIWVCCQYPTTVGHDAFAGAQRRCALPKGIMNTIRARLGVLLMLEPI